MIVLDRLLLDLLLLLLLHPPLRRRFSFLLRAMGHRDTPPSSDTMVTLLI